MPALLAQNCVGKSVGLTALGVRPTLPPLDHGGAPRPRSELALFAYRLVLPGECAGSNLADDEAPEMVQCLADWVRVELATAACLPAHLLRGTGNVLWIMRSAGHDLVRKNAPPLSFVADVVPVVDEHTGVVHAASGSLALVSDSIPGVEKEETVTAWRMGVFAHSVSCLLSELFAERSALVAVLLRVLNERAHPNNEAQSS